MGDRLPHLTALRVFEAAARHGSFQNAAGELGISPSAVSHHIRGLEDYLGVRLFERRTREVALTEAGVALHPGLDEGFRRIEDAVRRVRSLKRTSVIVVTAGPSIAAKWLVPRLYTFEEAHPEIEVRISTTNRVVDLGRADVDVAIRLGRGDFEGFDSVRLCGDAYTPLAAPRLRHAPGRPIRTVQDLALHRLLHDTHYGWSGVLPTWTDWLTAMGCTTVDGTEGPRFEQSDHALQAAVDGAGVLLGRLALAAPDIEAGRLTRLFDLDLPSPFSYHLVARAGRIAERPIAAFLEWIMGEFARTGIVPP